MDKDNALSTGVQRKCTERNVCGKRIMLNKQSMQTIWSRDKHAALEELEYQATPLTNPREAGRGKVELDVYRSS